MSKKKSAIRYLSDVSSSSPMGMLLAQRGNKIGAFQVGQKVTGKISDIGNKTVIVDIGAKAEGVIGDREFDTASSYIKSLKIGDTISATVTVSETSSGQVYLSLRDAASLSGWKLLEDSLANDTPVDIYVVNANRGGLTVTVAGIEAFVPTSQLGSKYGKNPQGAIGKTLQAKVQELDREKQRVVLSERAVSEFETIEKQQAALKDIKKGERFIGKVVGVVTFGAFVQITKDPSVDSGQAVILEGLVHLSQISWERVEDPSTVLQVGQEVEVVVIGKEQNRLALSIKQAQVDPWEKILEGIDMGKKLKGKVKKLGDFGAFIEIKPGLEGQVKLNKIPDGVSLREGDLVDVTVEDVDKKRHQISLGFVLTTKPVGYK